MLQSAIRIHLIYGFQGLAGVFPSQFQNDDAFQQLLVFLKNKDQEIGKPLTRYIIIFLISYCLAARQS